MAGASHVKVSIAGVGKDVRGQGGCAKLLVGLAIVASVFAQGVIAVAVSRRGVRVDRDEDGIREGGVGESGVESIAKDGKDGIRSDVGELRELGHLVESRHYGDFAYQVHSHS